MLKNINSIKLTHFVLILSFINFVLFHYTFFKFVVKKIEYQSINYVIVIVS